MPVAYIKVIDDATRAAATVDFATSCSSSNLHAVLSEFGFCVVSNVLTTADVALCRELFCSDLQSIVALGQNAFDATSTGQRIKNEQIDLADAWDLLSYPLGRVNPAFASDFGLPQGSAAWYVRSHPHIARVFSQLFAPSGETVELCTGMDNVFFNNLPPEEAQESERVDDIWPHADQSTGVMTSGAWDCYQGIVYLTNVDANSSATVIWPRSHLDIYEQIMAAADGDDDDHFRPLPQELEAQFLQHAVRVTLEQGSLLLWNSKTTHQGWNIGPRLAFPVCLEPKSRRTEEVLRDKREWVIKGYATTHWASLGVPHAASSVEPGGDDEFPLRAQAHLWAIDGEGVLPQIEALL